jgi:hypothetical protein
MHKSATKCNETIGKWCKNKHGASKIMDTFEMYQLLALMAVMKCPLEFRQPFKLYPAMWQEENNCINSAPEWVCKLNLLNCVYALHYA